MIVPLWYKNKILSVAIKGGRLRFYSEKGRSFHAKSYIFHYSSSSDIFIGSSNLSRSALTSGIEWNYRFSSNTDAENYQAFYDTFLDLFENHSIVIDDDVLRSYSKTGIARSR